MRMQSPTTASMIKRGVVSMNIPRKNTKPVISSRTPVGSEVIEPIESISLWAKRLRTRQ